MNHHPSVHYELARQRHAQFLAEAEQDRLAALGSRVSMLKRIRNIGRRRELIQRELPLNPAARPS